MIIIYWLFVKLNFLYEYKLLLQINDNLSHLRQFYISHPSYNLYFNGTVKRKLEDSD